MDAPPEMSVGIIIAAVLAVILCMAIATGMIVILIKRWVFGYWKKMTLSIVSGGIQDFDRLVARPIIQKLIDL